MNGIREKYLFEPDGSRSQNGLSERSESKDHHKLDTAPLIESETLGVE